MATRHPGDATWEQGAPYLIKIVHFWGVPPFWSILEHFHDLERIFPRNTAPSQDQPWRARQVLPPSPTLASLAPGRPRTYLDVFDPNTSSEGRGRGWGRGVAPAWLATAGPGWGPCFWGKSSLSRENAPKCSKMRFYGIFNPIFHVDTPHSSGSPPGPERWCFLSGRHHLLLKKPYFFSWRRDNLEFWVALGFYSPV